MGNDRIIVIEARKPGICWSFHGFRSGVEEMKVWESLGYEIHCTSVKMDDGETKN